MSPEHFQLQISCSFMVGLKLTRLSFGFAWVNLSFRFNQYIVYEATLPNIPPVTQRWVLRRHGSADICLSDKLRGAEGNNFIISISAFGTNIMQIQEADVLEVYIYSHIYHKKGESKQGQQTAVLLCFFVSIQSSECADISLPDHQWGLGTVHGAEL